MTAIVASVGDVFRVPLSEAQVGYGQVAAEYGTSGGHFYFVGFRAAFELNAEPELRTILGGRLALLALSMDPLIRIGHWPIVGHQPVEEGQIPWPTYKVATAPEVYAESDRFGSVRRQATPAQKAGLRYLSVVAPVRFENALKALNGLGEWRSEFDDLLIP